MEWGFRYNYRKGKGVNIFQSYAVISSAWEYWNRVEAVKDVCTEVRRSFSIDEE